MRAVFAIFLVAVLGSAGCITTVYEVEIVPKGDEFLRRVEVHQEGLDERTRPSLPDEMRARLRRVYGEPEVLREADRPVRHAFEDRFSDVPDDLGGAGTYFQWTTALGSLTSYTERLGGSDDLSGNLDRRLAAADYLADLVVAWFEGEFGDEPELAAAGAFLDTELRRDLANLVLLLAVSVGEERGEVAIERLLFRAGQYLRERDYFATEQLPGLVRAAETDDGGPLLEAARRLLARKAGLDKAALPPRMIEVLSDGQRFGESWDRHVAASAAYERILAERAEEAPSRPEPADLAVDLLTEAFLVGTVLGAPSPVTITFHSPNEPVATNGTWNAAAGVVRWEDQLDEKVIVPGLFYVVFAEPDEDAQQRHFGRVLLRGEDLQQYVVWYRALSAEEARQWDEFLDGVTPDDDLSAALEAFQFEGPAVQPTSREFLRVVKELFAP